MEQVNSVSVDIISKTNRNHYYTAIVSTDKYLLVFKVIRELVCRNHLSKPIIFAAIFNNLKNVYLILKQENDFQNSSTIFSNNRMF